MIQVTAGRLNKQIASDMGIAESTVKVHRTHVMRKMQGPFASGAQPNGGHA